MKTRGSREPAGPNVVNDPILADGGACGALLREHDWARSPLGVPSRWPTELRALVSILLGSMQPGFIVWGESRTVLYNDGFAAMCGERHPAALGNSLPALWGEATGEVEEMLAAAGSAHGSRLDELTFADGGGLPAGYAFSFTAVRDAAGRIRGFFCACVETTGQLMARRNAAAEIARLRQMFRHSPGAAALFSGPDHVFELANEAYLALVGRDGVLGEPAGQALPDLVGQGMIVLLDRVYLSGEPFIGRRVEARLPGAAAERRVWLDFVCQPVPDDEGRPTGIFVQIEDVTQRVLAESQQALLNREIAHRMKNQLAVVSAIVSQSLRNAGDLAGARRSVSDRIAALARAQTALLEKPRGKTTVADVVATFLEVHGGGGRIAADGPELAIGARPALSLSLILHELATNAFKYGALSNAEGRVRIVWECAREGGRRTFRLAWSEAGGPPVSAPARSSAGSRLIMAGLSGVADCRVEIDYAPGGLVCRIHGDAAGLAAEE